jgi:hypothetical protein
MWRVDWPDFTEPDSKRELSHFSRINCACTDFTEPGMRAGPMRNLNFWIDVIDNTRYRAGMKGELSHF